MMVSKMKRQNKNFFDEIFIKSNFLYSITFLLIIILFLSYNSRSWNEHFPGFESNYNQRIADQTNIFSDEFYSQDELSVYRTEIHYNIYNISLSFFSDFPVYLKIINMILALILVYLFYKFLRENHVSKLVANTSIFILILSPVFIFYSISLSVILFFTIITILSLLLLKKKHSVLTIFLSLLMPFFGIKFVIIYLFIILCYSIFINKIKYFYLIFGVVIGWALLVEYFFLNFSVFSFPMMTTYSLIRELVSEFGGIRGLSIMTFSLFVLGFMKLFFDKRRNIIQLLFLFGVISLFFFEYRFFFILNLAVSVYAGVGLSHLIRRKWFSEDLKNLTVLLIICGIAFTYLSFFGRIPELDPQSHHISSLEFLSHEEIGVVFTLPYFSTYVQNIARMPVIIDSFSYDQKIMTDINLVLYSQDLKTTISIFEKYGVKYVYLDKDMIDSVWQTREEGLLFLFSDQDHFQNIYSDDSVDVWKIITPE